MTKPRKRINILSNGVRERIRLPHELLPAGVGVIVLACVLGSAIRIGMAERAKRGTLATLTEMNARLTAEVQAFADRSRVIVAQTEQADSLTKLIARKNHWSDAFKELSSIVPDEVWLTGFTYNPENPARRLVLKGEATSQALVARLFALLERSRNFAGAVLITSQRDATVAPARYRFEFAVPAPGTPVAVGSASNLPSTAAPANPPPAPPAATQPPTLSAQAPVPGAEGQVR